MPNSATDCVCGNRGSLFLKFAITVDCGLPYYKMLMIPATWLFMLFGIAADLDMGPVLQAGFLRGFTFFLPRINYKLLIYSWFTVVHILT
jgi:hypothetical protein